MGGRPSGTVTFLFTDIEGSTRLWEHTADAMREALERHDRVVRAAIQRHGGHVFATGGDGYAVAFARAVDALNAAVEAQRGLAAEPWPAGFELKVRMAAHSGEVVEREGDYFGPAVNRAARMMSLAAGGQIVCSNVVRALCDTVPEIEFVDAGTHELRGVEEPMRVYVVVAEGLRALPLPVPKASGGNLPRPTTEFVGRVSELERLSSTLLQSRLVTLTGTGGVGKTRLAIELAWRTADEFADGVWLVELGAITGPEAVLHAVAASLSVRPAAGQDLEDAIVSVLANRVCLVLLDNCEHVVDAVEKLVTRILRDCREVTLLATSREPIDLREERVWRVRSMDAIEGAVLFTTRAGYVDAASVVGDEERATVLAISERLDGIPLAIELAAARMRSMTTSELLSRLDDRFRLLRGSRRGGVERHQTLRAAVTWSYQLLNEAERLLFDQCAVFAGSFDVDAVEAICATTDPIDVLASLVDKSMIIAERAELGTRYRLLETMRQYAEEQLDTRGLGAELRDRHLAYYAGLMTRTSTLYDGPGEAEAAAVYVQEWDNVRSAVAWGDTTEELEHRSKVLAATANFAVNTLRREHLEWTMTFITSSDESLVEVRSVAATLAQFFGEPGRAVALARDAIARASRSDDPETYYAWFGGHFGAFVVGDMDEAARMAAGCIASAGSNPARRARALVCQAQIAIVRDNDALEETVEQLKLCAEAMENATGWSFYLGDLGMLHLLRGDRERALASLEEALAWARKSGSVTLANGWQTALAYALQDAPNDTNARGMYARMISQCRTDDDWANMWIVLEAVAVHFSHNERLEPAGVLFAALARADRASLDFESARTNARERLEREEEMSRWRALGVAMSRAEVVDYALAQLASP